MLISLLIMFTNVSKKLFDFIRLIVDLTPKLILIDIFLQTTKVHLLKLAYLFATNVLVVLSYV